jgi:hypothetical protein
MHRIMDWLRIRQVPLMLAALSAVALPGAGCFANKEEPKKADAKKEDVNVGSAREDPKVETFKPMAEVTDPDPGGDMKAPADARAFDALASDVKAPTDGWPPVHANGDAPVVDPDPANGGAPAPVVDPDPGSPMRTTQGND